MRLFLSSSMFLLTGASAAVTPGPDLAHVAPVIASASDFKALLIVLCFLVGGVMTSLIGLLGYTVVRFLNASTATSAAMASMAATMSRMESTQASQSARIEDTLQSALMNLEREMRHGERRQ